jgi:small subunit ribosomal protein S13
MFKIEKTIFYNNISLEQSLLQFFGISNYNARKIMSYLSIHARAKNRFIQKQHYNDLNIFLTQYNAEEYKKYIKRRFELLKQIKHRRYIRAIKGLPIRGQRTHTNGRTCKTLSPNIWKN